MRPRARFWSLLGLLLVTLVICTAAAVSSIQRDLLVRSQRALTAAGMAFYGVEIDGRDVVLHGFVASAAQGQQIEDTVRSVPGVARIRNGLVVERVAQGDSGGSSGSAGATSPSQLPTLRLQGLGDRIVISGALPDDGSLEDLMQALGERYGPGNVSGRPQASTAIGRAAWLDGLPRLLDLLAKLDGNARLVIAGRRAHLFGEVSGQQARQQLQQSARRIGGLDWSFDLVARDGSTGGRAP